MAQKVQLSVSKKRNDRTSVSNLFLDQYMRDANGDFVKVYLYLLRCTNMEDSDIAVSEIADLLNLTEKDIIRALKYWVRVKALEVEFDETDTPVSIVFCPLEDKEQREKEAASVQAKAATDEASNMKASTGSGTSTERGTHRIPRDKASRLREQEDVSQLFFIVEKYIGRPINSTETNTILYFYDSLGFSPELIEYLVEYCVNNGHTSLRYMESVAVAWSDQGISSVNDAREASKMRNSQVTCVMKTFGIQDRNVTAVEMDFINRWFKEFCFSEELVTEACRRTIISVGKPNFSYAEKILKEWHKAEVKTMEEVKALDTKYRATRTTTYTTTTKPANERSTSTNKFNNFSNRTYNFDELEKSLIGSGSNQ